ncbi:unnamed protein product [Fraxinus pennsylvanica]|uniref:Uncharacterized protein n=1 Tax=Fraxinus pennsylvanica TaxID=56036 RepID=A0AAD2EGW0_9LAMI|nr:unnamed protein product [Fraxinus pennsylvanica]
MKRTELDLTSKVTIHVNSSEAAKGGDNMDPGTKIALISTSAESVTHVAPSEEKSSEKAAPSPLPLAEEKKKKPKPNMETTSVIEEPEETSSPPKPSATNPICPQKTRKENFAFKPLAFFFSLRHPFLDHLSSYFCEERERIVGIGLSCLGG